MTGTPGSSCDGPRQASIAWWPGQSNAADIVGGNNGTLQNGVTYEPGEVGTAFSFAGANEAVLIPYSASVNLSTLPAWTIEGWINPTSHNNVNWPTIFAQGTWDASHGVEQRNRDAGKLDQ